MLTQPQIVDASAFKASIPSMGCILALNEQTGPMARPPSGPSRLAGISWEEAAYAELEPRACIWRDGGALPPRPNPTPPPPPQETQWGMKACEGCCALGKAVPMCWGWVMPGTEEACSRGIRSHSHGDIPPPCTLTPAPGAVHPCAQD